MNTIFTEPPRLVRRRSMCAECPFREKNVETAMAMAKVDGFTCHMEDSPHTMGDSFIQCRGHWEAQRKHGRAGQVH